MAHFDNENYNDLSDAEYIKKFEADLKELDGNISTPSVENKQDYEFINELKEKISNKSLPENFDHIAKTYFVKKNMNIYINAEKNELTIDGIFTILKKRPQTEPKAEIITDYSIQSLDTIDEYFTNNSGNIQNSFQLLPNSKLETAVFILNTAAVRQGATSGSHWVTVAMRYNKEEEIIEYRYLDPQRAEKKDKVTEDDDKTSIIEGRNNFEKSLKNTLGNKIKGVKVIEKDTPKKQNDDFHCGDWCILYALELEKNGFDADIEAALKDVNNDNISKQREENLAILKQAVAEQLKDSSNIKKIVKEQKTNSSEVSENDKDNLEATPTASAQEEANNENKEVDTSKNIETPPTNLEAKKQANEAEVENKHLVEAERKKKASDLLRNVNAILEILEAQKKGVLTERQVDHIKQAIYLEAIKKYKKDQTPPTLENFYKLDKDTGSVFISNHEEIIEIISMLEGGQALLTKPNVGQIFDKAVAYLNGENKNADPEVKIVSTFFDNLVQHNSKKMDPKGPYRGLGVYGEVKKNQNGEISFVIKEVFKESVLYEKYKDTVKAETNGIDASSVEIVTINGVSFAKAIEQLMFKENEGAKETNEEYQKRTGIKDLAALKKEIGDDFSVNNQKFVEWAVIQLIRGQNIGSDAHKDQANKQLGIQIKSTNPNNNNQPIDPINHTTRIFDSETHKPYTMNADIAREQRKALVSKLQDSETIKTYLSSSDQTKVDALAKDLQSFLEKANNAYKQPKEPGKKTSQENRDIKKLAKEVFNEVKDLEKMEESFVQKLAERQEQVKKVTTQEKKGNQGGVTVHL